MLRNRTSSKLEQGPVSSLVAVHLHLPAIWILSSDDCTIWVSPGGCLTRSTRCPNGGWEGKVTCLKNFFAITDIQYEVNISKIRNSEVYGNKNYHCPCYLSLL